MLKFVIKVISHNFCLPNSTTRDSKYLQKKRTQRCFVACTRSSDSIGSPTSNELLCTSLPNKWLSCRSTFVRTAWKHAGIYRAANKRSDHPFSKRRLCQVRFLNLHSNFRVQVKCLLGVKCLSGLRKLLSAASGKTNDYGNTRHTPLCTWYEDRQWFSESRLCNPVCLKSKSNRMLMDLRAFKFSGRIDCICDRQIFSAR